MIIKTFSKQVVIIPRDTEIPYIPKHTPGKKGIKVYEIPPSSIVLVGETRKKSDGKHETVIKITCGYDIYPYQIDRMIDYLIALSTESKSILEIQECGNLKHLNKLDKFVQAYNENL